MTNHVKEDRFVCFSKTDKIKISTVSLLQQTEWGRIQNQLNHSTYRSLFGTWEYGTSFESSWSDIFHEQCVLTSRELKRQWRRRCWFEKVSSWIRDSRYHSFDFECLTLDVGCEWVHSGLPILSCYYSELQNTAQILQTSLWVVSQCQIVVFTLVDNRLHFFPYLTEDVHSRDSWLSKFGLVQLVCRHIFFRRPICASCYIHNESSNRRFIYSLPCIIAHLRSRQFLDNSCVCAGRRERMKTPVKCQSSRWFENFPVAYRCINLLRLTNSLNQEVGRKEQEYLTQAIPKSKFKLSPALYLWSSQQRDHS